MTFNTWAYYLFFLVPSAILFRLSPLRYRPWVIVAGGSSFFLYFSCTESGRIIPAACLGIFLWESIPGRFYRPKSWFCWVGVAQAVVLLFIFKYWNFFSRATLLGARFLAAGNGESDAQEAPQGAQHGLIGIRRLG
jgi:alginate O-acetyltransferase complex protein AlgI